MRVYLAGPMTGIPAMNFPAFDAAATDLRARGYDVVSPSELDDPEDRSAALGSEDGDLSKLESGKSWGDFLARDVKLIADEGIEAIVVLPDWEQSRGARLETFIGRLCGLPIVHYQTGYELPGVRRWDIVVAHGSSETPPEYATIEDPVVEQVEGFRIGDRVYHRFAQRHGTVDSFDRRMPIEQSDIMVKFDDEWGTLMCDADNLTYQVDLLKPAVLSTAEQFDKMFGPKDGEVRVTNAQTGGQKGSKPQAMSLLPWDVLMFDVAPLYFKGAEKYERDNWRKGYDWSLSFDALARHLAQFHGGQWLDEETDCAHLASVVFHACALMYFYRSHPELNDVNELDGS